MTSKMSKTRNKGGGDRAQGPCASTSNVSSLNINILRRVETKVVAPRNPKLVKTTSKLKVRVSVVDMFSCL